MSLSGLRPPDLSALLLRPSPALSLDFLAKKFLLQNILYPEKKSIFYFIAWSLFTGVSSITSIGFSFCQIPIVSL
jgi:hypothetical protein